jgi:hypothetical protein
MPHIRYRCSACGEKYEVSRYRVRQWTNHWCNQEHRTVRATLIGVCDCIVSGNPEKPKQHGADPHAKSCAIYREKF